MAEKESTPKSKDDEKILAALATIPGVGLIIYLVMKDASAFVKHYAKQSIGLLVFIPLWVIFGVLSIIPWVGFIMMCLNFVLILAYVALWLMLLVNALQEKMYSLPVLTDLVNKVLKD